MDESKTTVVLAHGAFTDGSSWSGVIEELGYEGIRTIAAALPLTSFADDIAAVERAVEHAGGPVVLVGHSYAGAVIDATRSAAVKALVFVTAFLPDEGESVLDVLTRVPPPAEAAPLAPDANGFIWLPPGTFATAIAQHATARQQMILEAVHRPIGAACVTAKVGRPRARDLPSAYFLGEDDHMITPAHQRFMAERLGARVVAHGTDHVPQITAPAAVTALIHEVLRASSHA